MSSEIKVGDRVRLIRPHFSGMRIVVEGILEEIGSDSGARKVNGLWHSDLLKIEKISDGAVEEKVKEKIERKNRTTIDEDLMNALIS